MLTYLAQPLVAGTIMCMCGDPGTGKSFALLQALIHWEKKGIKACIYQLEDDRVTHMKRLWGQIASESRLTENNWMEANPVATRELLAQFKSEVANLGRKMYEAPEEQASLEMLSAWVEARAKAGYEIICIDPVTAAAPEAKPWLADCQFVMRVKMIIRRYRRRLILIVHPRKGQDGKGGLDDMAGGAAYSRFSHSVIWFHTYDKEEELAVRPRLDFLLTENLIPNRIVKIVKSRNGTGRGKRIAMDFSHQALTLKELGIIQNEK